MNNGFGNGHFNDFNYISFATEKAASYGQCKKSPNLKSQGFGLWQNKMADNKIERATTTHTLT